MRTDIRTKQVTETYKVYVAKDGKEFKYEEDCINHEKIIDGTRIVCPECHGEGKIAMIEEYNNYHTGVPERTTIYPTCPKCNGKGYLEKKIKEVWE